MTGFIPQADDDIQKQLLEIVAAEGMVDPSRIKPEANLEELGIKSADFVMILMAIEEKFGVYLSVDDELTEAKTVGDLLSVVMRRIREYGAKSP